MYNKFFQVLKEYLIVTFACIIMALNTNYFFIGNKLAQGGVSGISLIIHYLSAIDTGYLYFILNIPLLILAYLFLGKNFLIKTLFATFVLSVFLKIFSNIRGTLDDVLLASIFGGGINGISVGLIFYAGGSTGGVDIMAKIVNKFYGISIGKILMIADFIVLSLVAFIFGKLIFMYTLISLLISSKMVDAVQDGIYSAKGVTIITNKPEELKKRIMEDIQRGLTIIRAEGAYTGNDVTILYCIIGKYQLVKVKNIVKEVDPTAFMIVNQVHEVIGKGFLKQ